MTYSNGDFYEGEFENDVKNGTGKVTYSNGDFYEGEFENDKFNGKGKLTRKQTFTDEEFYTETYDGEFENGKFNGEGKLTCFGKCKGHVFNENSEGYWSNNQLYSKNSKSIDTLLGVIIKYEEEKLKSERENKELKRSLKDYTNFIPPVFYYTG
jgi:hypothetical protein